MAVLASGTKKYFTIAWATLVMSEHQAITPKSAPDTLRYLIQRLSNFQIFNVS